MPDRQGRELKCAGRSPCSFREFEPKPKKRTCIYSFELSLRLIVRSALVLPERCKNVTEIISRYTGTED